MSRWIRVSTSIFDHDLFSDETFTEREAWLWLISKAAWKETRHRIGGAMVDVSIGSLFVTLRELQETWKWGSDYRVRTFLKLLQSEEMISVDANSGKTLVTICNYDRYQNPERAENAAKTHTERKENALKTPVHQDTSNTSSLRSDVCPEPENSAPASSSPSVIDLPATQGQTVSITEADVAEWRDAFPAVDVPQQLRAMRQWLLANERNRKTVRGMRKFVVSWLSRDQDRGGARQHNGHQSQAPPGRPGRPPSPAMQRHERIKQNIRREIYGDDDADPSSPTIDLAARDYFAH